jgi:hypothetical protein
MMIVLQVMKVLMVASMRNIIVTYVCNPVSQFFQHGWMLPNLSYNVVVLILKFTGTDRSEDYHPKALAKAKNVGEGNTQ